MSRARSNSFSVTNQRTNGDCFAHAAARIIVRAIKLTIPDLFFPEDDKCDEFYDIAVIDNPFERITECTPNSANSLYLYIYIYKLIAREFGCNSGFIFDCFNYFIKLVENNELFDKTLLVGVEEHDIEQIRHLLDMFLTHIHANNLTFFATFIKLNEVILKDHYELFVTNYLDPSLSNGYYIGLSGSFQGSPHGLTIIGYEKTESDKVTLIVKNSWGKKNITFNGLTQIDGIFRYTLDEFFSKGLDTFTILLLETKEDREKRKRDEEDSENEDSENEDSENEDSQYKKIKRTGGKKRNTKKSRKSRKSKKTRKTRKTRKIRNTKKKHI